MTHAMKIRASAVAVLLATMGGVAWSDGVHKMTLAKDLQWTDVASLPPGAKVAIIEGPMNEPVPFTIRIKFPANYQLPAHVHPGIERVTALTGTFYMGMGEKFEAATATMALGPGDVMIMEPNTPHYAMTKEETIVQVHSTGPWQIIYVNPGDDPRKKQ